MARSTKGSNQRPDTLMQDRTSPNSKQSSCNVRPDHTFGSFSSDRHVASASRMSASLRKRTSADEGGTVQWPRPPTLLADQKGRGFGVRLTVSFSKQAHCALVA